MIGSPDGPERLVAAKKRKRKVVSVLLDISLSFCTWLYTYKKDAWKFWVGLGVSVANVILIAATLGLWLLVAWAVAGGIWLWAVIDAAVKPDRWYEDY